LSGSETKGRKRWSGARAWEITERLEAEMRKMQAEGWRCSPEASKRFDALLATRYRIENAHDMGAFERNAVEMLQLCKHDQRQQQKRREAWAARNAPAPTAD
jgi:hypothetical protein